MYYLMALGCLWSMGLTQTAWAQKDIRIADFESETYPPGWRAEGDAFGKGPQCFSRAPDGRIIQVGWGKIETPDMPFNQVFSLPMDLTLRTTDEGLRLFGNPVKEIETLRKPDPVQIAAQELSPNRPAMEFAVKGQEFDLLLTLKKGTASKAMPRDGACCQLYPRGNDAGKPVETISVQAQGGAATIESLAIFEMNSIWKKPAKH